MVRPSLSHCRLLLRNKEFLMPERVLIIDDEENIRQMLRLTLETADYEVGEAGDGMEAFAILGGDPAWNAILLDQRLPIMEGTEVLRRIMVLAPQARVGDDDCVCIRRTGRSSDEIRCD
jgi:CheY-like chemotaxis protein